MRLEEKNCEHIAVDHDSQFGIVTAIVEQPGATGIRPLTVIGLVDTSETVFADDG